MSVAAMKPGDRHPSWPWWMRAGMFIHLNYPDGPEISDERIVGHVDGGARDGQPVFLAVDEFPLTEGRTYDFRVRHPMLCAPVAHTRRAEWERATDALFVAGASREQQAGESEA